MKTIERAIGETFAQVGVRAARLAGSEDYVRVVGLEKVAGGGNFTFVRPEASSRIEFQADIGRQILHFYALAEAQLPKEKAYAAVNAVSNEDAAYIAGMMDGPPLSAQEVNRVEIMMAKALLKATSVYIPL